MTTPPSIDAGNSHDVARESPGLSRAIHAMPVGKMGAIARPVTIYANGAARPLSATSSATDAIAAPPITTAGGETLSGISAANSLPTANANQKPDVSEAASKDRNPIDSR